MNRKWLLIFSAPLTLAACGNANPSQNDRLSDKSPQTQAEALLEEAVENDDPTVAERASDAASDAGDSIKDASGAAADKAGDAYDATKDKASDVYDATKDKTSSAYDATKNKIQDGVDAIHNKAQNAWAAADDKADKVKEKAKDSADEGKKKAKEAKDDAKDAAEEGHQTAADLVEPMVVDAQDAVERARNRGHEALGSAVESAKLAYDRSRDNAARMGTSIEESTIDLRDYASDRLGDAAQAAIDKEEDLQAREEDRTDQILHEGDVAWQDGRARGETALSRGADAVEDAADDAKQAAESASERAKQNLKDAGNFINHKAHRAADNVYNHQEEFRKKNAATFDKGVDAAKSAWDTFKHGSKVITTPVASTAQFTADRFRDSASWANQVRKDTVAWERSHRTAAEKQLTSRSAKVSGYLAGIFAGTVQGAKDVGNKTADKAYRTGEKAAHKTNEAANEASESVRQATADALHNASDRLDEAGDKAEPSSDYASIGLNELPNAHMGFALGVELFADRICEGLRDTKKLNADEMTACLEKQRGLYNWYYGAEQCQENGFKADTLNECLTLAPETAGGLKGEARGFTAPLNSASRKFYWNCQPSAICAP